MEYEEEDDAEETGSLGDDYIEELERFEDDEIEEEEDDADEDEDEEEEVEDLVDGGVAQREDIVEVERRSEADGLEAVLQRDGEDDEEEDEDEYELEMEFFRSRRRKRVTGEDRAYTHVDEILEEDRWRERSGRGRKRRKLNQGLPKHLEGLMGQANLHYMKKQFDDSLKILRDIVREAPRAIPAYHTLGLVHEELEDSRRALDFYMIAALLERSDASLWKKNGISSLNLGNIDQAVFCFSMAVKTSKGQDLGSMETLAELRARRGEIRRSAETYERVLKRTPTRADIALKVVGLYESISLPERAVVTLRGVVEESISKGIETLQPILMEKLIDLLLNLKRYTDAGALLSRYSLVTASHPVKFTMDLRVRLAVCNIRLGSQSVSEDLRAARDLLPVSFEERDKYLWELGEALLDTSHYALSVSLFNELAEGGEHSARLLLRRGAAYKELGKFELAKADLEQAVELSPGLVEASVLLVDIYPRVGQADKITGVLSRIEGSAKERVDALAAAKDTVQRILTFAQRYETGDRFRYVETLLPLMDAACNLPRRNARDVSKAKAADREVIDQGREPLEEEVSDHRSEGEWLFQFKTGRRKKRSTGTLQKYGFSMRDVGIAVRKVLSDKEYLTLLEKFWKAMCAVGREDEAASIISRLVYLKPVMDPALVERLRLLGVAASIRGGQLLHAYDEMRALCTEKTGESTFWFVLASLVELAQKENRKGLVSANIKFAKRVLEKNPQALPCLMNVANGFYDSGSYRCAEALYLRSYTLDRKQPLTCLLLAVVYIHLGQARRIRNKAECVLKGLTFFQEYRRLREDGTPIAKAEVLYNFGRYYQFCNVPHLAAPIYEEVLALNVPEGGKNILRDAAYNLVRLYHDVGSIASANRVMRTHLAF